MPNPKMGTVTKDVAAAVKVSEQCIPYTRAWHGLEDRIPYG